MMHDEIIIEMQSPFTSIPFELVLKISSFLEELMDINNFAHTNKDILEIMKKCPMVFDKPIKNGNNAGTYGDYLAVRYDLYNKGIKIKKITPSQVTRSFVTEDCNVLFDGFVATIISLSLFLSLALTGIPAGPALGESLGGGILSFAALKGLRFFCNKKINHAATKISDIQADLDTLPKLFN